MIKLKMTSPLKFSLIGLTLLFIPIHLSSQSTELYFGFSSGMTVSKISQTSVFSEYYKNAKGLGSFINIGIRLSPHLYVQTDVGYLQNGRLLKECDPIKTIYYTSTNSYIGFRTLLRQHYIDNSWQIGYQFVPFH